MEKNKGKYTLIVGKKRIEVSKEIYKAYYKCRNRERYLDKLAKEKNISFEACSEKGIQLEYLLASMQESLEDSIIMKETTIKMLQSLKQLDENEKWLVDALYYRGKSEYQVASQLGISRQGVHKRIIKILAKLKNLMEI